MGLFDNVGQIWTFARKIEDLLALQHKTETVLELIDARLLKLETRMTQLEAERGQMITEAKAAAGMAASGIASAIVSDTVTRITRLEMRQADHVARLPIVGSADDLPPVSTQS